MKRPAIDGLEWRLLYKHDFEVCELSVLDVRLLIAYIKGLEERVNELVCGLDD